MKRKSPAKVILWKAKCKACSYKSKALPYKEASKEAVQHSLTSSDIKSERHEIEYIRLEFTCRRLNCTQLTEANETLCDRCKKKDKARKRTILKRQRALGIKTRKRKQKVKWKEKPQEKFVNPQLKKFEVRRDDAQNGSAQLLLRSSPEEEWRPIKKGYITRLQNRGEIIVWI